MCFENRNEVIQVFCQYVKHLKTLIEDNH